MHDLYPEQCLRELTPDESRLHLSFSSISSSRFRRHRLLKTARKHSMKGVKSGGIRPGRLLDWFCPQCFRDQWNESRIRHTGGLRTGVTGNPGLPRSIPPDNRNTTQTIFRTLLQWRPIKERFEKSSLILKLQPHYIWRSRSRAIRKG